MVSWPSRQVLTFAAKGEGPRGQGRRAEAHHDSIAAEDVWQFWRRGAGKGGEGVLKALGEHLGNARGFWIGEVEQVKAATRWFVLAVECKAKFFKGRGSSV